MVENYIDNLCQGRIITEGYFNDWKINNINLTITGNIDSFLFIDDGRQVMAIVHLDLWSR
jgi:hypothetical protein